MRISIMVFGIAVMVIGVPYLLFYSSDLGLLLIGLLAEAFGALNLALGFATAKTVGVTIPSATQSRIKMVVDRGVIGSTVYALIFLETKVVLKKLTSGIMTVLAVIALAVIGLFLFNSFIGAAIGGLTAFSLQEFWTQRRRNAAVREDLTSVGRGDLEFKYADLKQVQLTKSRIRLSFENGRMGIVISRKYPPLMLPVLEKLVPSLIREGV